MKFVREMNETQVIIPKAALRLCGLEQESKLEMRVQDGTVVLLPASMTALELAKASAALYELATELFKVLVDACGPCHGCDGEIGVDCTIMDTSGKPEIRIPEWALAEAGIPPEAKLECSADENTGIIYVSEACYTHDLTDLPPTLLAALREKGICFGELQECIVTEEIVYGE